MELETAFRSGDGVWALGHGMSIPEYGIVVEVDVRRYSGTLVAKPDNPVDVRRYAGTLVAKPDTPVDVSYTILLPSGLRNILGHRVFATREEAVAWGGKRLELE
jgi:hypothetical protein